MPMSKSAPHEHEQHKLCTSYHSLRQQSAASSFSQQQEKGFPVLSDVLCLLQAKDFLKGSSLSFKEARSLRVRGASADSRNVAPGNIFICKGAAFKPSFAVQAVARGAVAILCSSQWEIPVKEELAKAPTQSSKQVSDQNNKQTHSQANPPLIVVSDMRVAMAEVSALAWGYPNQGLCIIGVTGTKGKSTTTSLVKALLDVITGDASQTAYLGTHHIFNGKETHATVNTTPEPPDLWRTLFEAESNGCKYVVMEVSSQALKYGRTHGLAFDVACFLNIGTDHISDVEHPTFEDYLQSKLRIFDQAKRVVLNIDTDYLLEVENYLQEHFTHQIPDGFGGAPLFPLSHEDVSPTAKPTLGEAFGARTKQRAECSAATSLLPLYTVSLANPEANYYASDISVLSNARQSMHFTFHAPTYSQKLTLGMSGECNVLDAIGALAITGALNIPEAAQKEAAKTVFPRVRVPGRMEIISSPDKRIIGVVDYAHNDLSFETFFHTMNKNYPEAYVIALFGVSGGKALNRYQDLPRIASAYADFLFLTSDEPGTVDPHLLLDEMEKSVAAGTSFAKEIDREKAVERAYSKAQEVLQSGEATQVIICALGKGDETTMEIGGKTISIEPDAAHLKRLLTQK